MIISIQDSLNLLNIVISPFHKELAIHLQRTAYISLSLARALHLSDEQTQKIYLAAHLHNIGVICGKSLRNGPLPESGDSLIGCKYSAKSLLRDVRFLQPLLPIIDHHHSQNINDRWLHSISIENQIINLADEFELFLRRYDDHLLVNARTIIDDFFSSHSHISPQLTAAFADLAKQDIFWFRLESERLHSVLKKISPLNLTLLSNEDFLEICALISRIVDNYSSFTGTHSTSVANVAGCLSSLLGYSRQEQQEITIAGYLHDVGKVYIPVDILEKEGRLTADEYALVREHSYKTLVMLMLIKPLGNIVNWAANHHERLDGSGYPFGLKSEALDMPSRILAVADVFTALTENRPYRKGLPPHEALDIIKKEGDCNRLDRDIINILTLNLQQVYQQVILI